MPRGTDAARATPGGDRGARDDARDELPLHAHLRVRAYLHVRRDQVDHQLRGIHGVARIAGGRQSRPGGAASDERNSVVARRRDRQPGARAGSSPTSRGRATPEGSVGVACACPTCCRSGIRCSEGAWAWCGPLALHPPPRRTPACPKKETTGDSPDGRRSEAGQTTALVCAMLFTLAMFVALVVNVGQMVNRRVALQLVADAGAWSGATVQAVQLNHYAFWSRLMQNAYKNASGVSFGFRVERMLVGRGRRELVRLRPIRHGAGRGELPEHCLWRGPAPQPVQHRRPVSGRTQQLRLLDHRRSKRRQPCLRR